ncbi:MAG TPA: FtsX-like permease family protein [Longilinea sp.]|nr:FtsX-like permease family protein [Longilinea sp.]
MQLYLRMAWRNIWRHRRRTIIVLSALGIGLAFMIFYDGLIDGFDQAIYGNAIKVLGGNIRVHAPGYSESTNADPLLPLTDDQAVVKAAQSIPNVVAASRRINTGGLASNREGAFAVSIIGIEPEAEASANLIAQHVTGGRYLTSEDQDSLLIGQGLADLMNVQVGDRITLVGQSTHEQMRQRTMTIVGIYSVGVTTLEQSTVYISLAEAQDLYNLPGQSTEVIITLKKLGDEPSVISALSASMPGDEYQTWAQAFPELQNAVGAKNQFMTILSFIIVLIAAIGVINLLLMAVYERTREIGLLGALGFRPRQITLLFVLEGAMLGLAGVLVGAILGYGINAIFGVVGMDFSAYTSVTSYMALITGKIYPSFVPGSLLTRSLPVLVITVLAALYPAHEAARHEPAEDLHYV